MAVVMCLGLLAMAVMPLAVGEFEYGWVASSFGLARSIGHREAVGAIAAGISAVAALTTIAFLPATAPI